MSPLHAALGAMVGTHWVTRKEALSRVILQLSLALSSFSRAAVTKYHRLGR